MRKHPFGVTICDRTIRIHGEVDLAVRDQLVAAITALAQSAEGSEIVVDLSSLTFIDSTGIGALMHAVETVREVGKKLVIQNVPERIRRTFNYAEAFDYLTSNKGIPA